MIDSNVIAKIVQLLGTVTLKPSDIADYQAVLSILEQEFMKARNPQPQVLPAGAVIPTDSDLIPL